MARRVFFSFHYKLDIFRSMTVRNANVVLGVEESGFFDHSEYEDAKKKGDEAIRSMIRRHLDGTSVTVVLVGALTSTRRWVDFEIRESIARGNGLIAVRIHHLYGATHVGCSPLRYGSTFAGRLPPALPSTTPVYTWQTDPAGVRAFGRMIEEAGQRSDRLKANRAWAQKKSLLDMLAERKRARAYDPPPSRPSSLFGKPPTKSPDFLQAFGGQTLSDLLQPPPSKPSTDHFERMLREILADEEARRYLEALKNR